MSAVGEADDVLMAELAFGLLDAEEEAAARDRIAGDRGLSARLVIWERLALALLVRTDEIPRPSLWQEIDDRLPGNDNAPESSRPAARWRAASIALGVVACVLGALALRPPAAPPTPPAPHARPAPAPLVAVLRAPGAAATVAVNFDPGSDRLTFAAQALDARAGSVELWAIPADGTPRSLGVIASDAPAWRVSPKAARLIAPGVTLAITLEPRGGSPTGRPSATPLLTGMVVAAAHQEPSV